MFRNILMEITFNRISEIFNKEFQSLQNFSPTSDVTFEHFSKCSIFIIRSHKTETEVIKISNIKYPAFEKFSISHTTQSRKLAEYRAGNLLGEVERRVSLARKIASFF